MRRRYSENLITGSRISAFGLREGVVYDIQPADPHAEPFRGTYTGNAGVTMTDEGIPRYTFIFVRHPEGDHVEICETATFYSFPFPRYPDGTRVIDGDPLTDEEAEAFTQAMLRYGVLK